MANTRSRSTISSPLNGGTLLNWSVKVNSTVQSIPQFTAAAQPFRPAPQWTRTRTARADQNPLTTPFTGLTPGDAYVAPMPQPATPYDPGGDLCEHGIRFPGPHASGHRALHFQRRQYPQPAVQPGNSSPLIFSGPYVTSTSVPSGTGSDNLITERDDQHVQCDVQTGPCKPAPSLPSKVQQIMGPVGTVLRAPQYYASGHVSRPDDSLGRRHRRPTSSARLNSTAYHPAASVEARVQGRQGHGSTRIAEPSRPIRARRHPDRATDGTTQVPLFTMGLSRARISSTPFSATANSITTGTSPYTGTFKPSSATLRTRRQNG